MGILEDLQEERRLIAERLAAIDKAIKEYQLWETRVFSLLDSKTVVSPGTKASLAAWDPHEPMTQDWVGDVFVEATPMPKFLAAVDAIIDEIEHPLTRGPFLEALSKRGVAVGGSDERNTLSARLSRIPHVVNLRGYGFWKRDRPYPMAQYNPKPRDTDVKKTASLST